MDARFEGQAHEISVPLPDLGADSLVRVEQDFRARYAEAYGVAPEGRIEYAALRVRLHLPVPRPPLQRAEGDSGPEPVATRQAWFGPEAPVEAAVYHRERLSAGARLQGPAVVEGSVETVVVPPGYGAHVDEVGSVVVRPNPGDPGDAGNA